MSFGIVICGVCKREVHQDGENQSWRHCEDKTARCEGAYSTCPNDLEEIVGEWCGRDA